MTTALREQIIEFLADVRERAEEIELLRTQKESMEQLSCYNGQLEELRRIMHKSRQYFGIDEAEVAVVHNTLQQFELNLQDRAGAGYQAVIKAMDIDHATRKAAREYPDYQLVEVKHVAVHSPRDEEASVTRS
ncbi:hypothetical protein [Paenibacillus xerothermodurans]|uniref:Uncharacterized protein n=1 Tax=Paenibacillus xerothermodurans TaxID=1977292 RepID=A0A2W1NAS2_PAEXE|nr:hypothetical protein [Paenibacillus xerothermodurans]PZE20730.1 hypothetical protein CBW46_011210 [Paenibacillus xerothermodurans]